MAVHQKAFFFINKITFIVTAGSQQISKFDPILEDTTQSNSSMTAITLHIRFNTRAEEIPKLLDLRIKHL